MSNEIFESNERKFLHDIATPISLLKLHSLSLIKIFYDRPSSEAEQRVLNKILKAIAALEELHADQRARIAKCEAS